MSSRPRPRPGNASRRKLAVGNKPTSPSKEEEGPILQPDFDVVVVGAGISGLAAAHRLKQDSPEKKIVVLEARERIGGRVLTDTSLNGVPIDLGAAWLHDLSNDNPLADFVRKSKITTKISDYDYDAGTHWDLRPDWKDGEDYVEGNGETEDGMPKGVLMKKEEVEKLAKEYDDFFSKLNTNREALFNKEDAEDVPLANLVAETKAQLGIDEDSKKSAWLDDMIYAAVEEVEAAETDELSALFFDEVDVDVNGGVNLLFPEGAWTLFQPLAENIDIRLRQEVTSVTYDTRSKVAVLTTSTGTRFTATTVIVTVPLGVLKSKSIAFTPALPKRLAGSIETLGYGTLDKIVLLFPYGALDKIMQSRSSEILHLHHDSDEETDGFRIVELFNFARWTDNLPGKPKVDGLIGFVAGRGARQMEKMKDKDVLDVVMDKLKRLDDKLVEPVGYRITRWAMDPFSKGSYSFHGPGSHPSDHDIFTQPIGGWLYFAGEHTSDLYPATMQGAYTSGLRVASEISTEWMNATLPPHLRVQKSSQTDMANLPLGGLNLPSSGIPESVDKIVAGGELGGRRGDGADPDKVLQELAKASGVSLPPGFGGKDEKKKAKL